MRSTQSPLTGVQRYALEVLNRFPKEYEERKFAPSRSPGTIKGQFWEQLLLPILLSRGGGLLWSPANVGPLAVKNQVVTIHDASTFDHPEWFGRLFATWYRFLLPRLARRSLGVVTVSYDAKRRLLPYLKVPEDKVRVIWNGVSGELSPLPQVDCFEFRKRHSIMEEERYFAFVGSLEPRKNLKRLLEAWEVSGLAKSFSLLIAGSAGRVFAESGLGEPPAGCRFLGRIADEDLNPFLSGAHAFVFPSLYEGFGLPPLEALACGTRVAVSVISVLEEVCGECASYFDPEDVESIAGVLRRLAAESGEEREAAIGKGLIRASTFTWERSAREHMEFFNEIMETLENES